MGTTAILAVILLSITAFYQEVNSQCTGSIGTYNERSFTVVKASRFYLNTAAPATCGGTMSEMRFCYYNSYMNITDDQIFYASLAIYRPMKPTHGLASYAIASDLFNISLTGSQIRASGNFTCSAASAVFFDVVVGDVIGACVFNPNGSQLRRLDIVGEASGYSLMQTMDADGCSTDSIPSTISSSDLSVVISRILHVYTNITNPIATPPTSPMSTTEQVTSVPWTTMNPTEPSTTSGAREVVSQVGGRLDLEVVVVMVIVAVLSVVVGTTIVLTAVVFFNKRRNKSGHFSTTVVGQCNGTVQATAGLGVYSGVSAQCVPHVQGELTKLL